MKLSLLFISAMFASLLNTCTSGSGGNSLAEEVSAMQAPKSITPRKPPAEGGDQTPINRQLIKTGSTKFESLDFDKSRNQILNAASKYEAYVSSDREYTNAGRRSHTIEVRVPSQHFDDFLAEAVDGVRHIEFKEINVKDVTEEFLDIKARLETKKKLEQRYVELLAKAQTISEILEIDNQIGNLRSDIESIEGRLRYMESQIALSTITLTFFDPHATNVVRSSRFADAFRSGWSNMIHFILALVRIWPFLLALVLFVWFLTRLGRKKKPSPNPTDKRDKIL